jgi:hypothetical protein
VVVGAVAAAGPDEDWIEAPEAARLLGLTSGQGARKALAKLGFEPKSAPTAVGGKSKHLWRRRDVEVAVRMRDAADGKRIAASKARRRPAAEREAELIAQRALSVERAESERLVGELAQGLDLRYQGRGGEPSGVRLRGVHRPAVVPVEGAQGPADHGAGRTCVVCGLGGVSRYAAPDPIFGDSVHSGCSGLDGGIPAGWMVGPDGQVLVDTSDEALRLRTDWIEDWIAAGRVAAVALRDATAQRREKARRAALDRSDRRVIEAPRLVGFVA